MLKRKQKKRKIKNKGKEQREKEYSFNLKKKKKRIFLKWMMMNHSILKFFFSVINITKN